MKKLIALILALMMVLGMGGCGGSTKEPEPTETPAPTATPTPSPTPTPKIEFFSQCSNLPKPDSFIDVDYYKTIQGVIYYTVNADSEFKASLLCAEYIVAIGDYGFTTQKSDYTGVQKLFLNSTQVGTIGTTQENGIYYLAFYFN